MIHLYRAALDRAAPAAAEPLLSNDERARAAGYRAARDRDRFVAARGLLRRVLARHTGVDPARLRFVAGPHGKPALAGAGPQFNLSHAAGWAIVGVTAAGALGVDLEPLDDVPELDALIADHLAPVERAYVRDRRDGHVAAFLRVWVCKEAYLKARGEGLLRPLVDVAIRFDDRGAPRVVDPADQRPWSLALVDAVPGHACAVAVQSASLTIRVEPIAPLEPGL